MTSKMYSKLCRVYFNKSGNEGKLWSVDCGVGTPETIVGRVCVTNVHGYTDYIKEPKDEAKAWLVFFEVEITIDVDKNIALINGV